MRYFFQNIKNIVDFSIRQKIAISRKNYFEQNESKEGLLQSQDEIDKEQYLCDKYDLAFVKNSTTQRNYLENLYILDLLDRYLSIYSVTGLNVLDIGCKNWFYAKGEYFFFKKYCDNLAIDGIELDANRLYSNFYSRKEVAKFHIKDLKGANYIADDFLKHNKKYDYIIWILPFVLEYPLFKWGLPHSYFKPEEMLKHAYDLLNENGQIFIINQGKNEYEAQKSLFNKLNIKFQDIGLIKSVFPVYTKERYLISTHK